MARVVLYSIRGYCPLCDQARDVLSRIVHDFDEIDIKTDPELLREYKDQVPVVAVDGRPEFFGRVEPARLRALLSVPPDRE